MATRKIGSGWFGTLSLPRVINLWNVSQYYDEETLFLRTEPLPELSSLRSSSGLRRDVIVNSTLSVNVSSSRYLELDIEVNRKTLKEDFDVSTRVLMSEDGTEYTEVGIRDATWLPGVDLWDDVNDDENDNITVSNATECQLKCVESATCTSSSFQLF